eukprot:TRINITY_DN10974_c0_g2_i2.p3 TRINITY_DN10974_c0_g2~~TRINITY_DN10974_c0_g2_i2.p3  ORF type:complete len:132 (-),score=7.18 TRINITY_DN10974_c0_g2_i2:134-484(-)
MTTSKFSKVHERCVELLVPILIQSESLVSQLVNSRGGWKLKESQLYLKGLNNFVRYNVKIQRSKNENINQKSNYLVGVVFEASFLIVKNNVGKILIQYWLLWFSKQYFFLDGMVWF